MLPATTAKNGRPHPVAIENNTPKNIKKKSILYAYLYILKKFITLGF